MFAELDDRVEVDWGPDLEKLASKLNDPDAEDDRIICVRDDKSIQFRGHFPSQINLEYLTSQPATGKADGLSITRSAIPPATDNS